MLPRLVLKSFALPALLLLATGCVQPADTALSAVVRISGLRGGTPVRGSGFVVGLDGEGATIFTAAHVIQGTEKVVVTFAVDPTAPFPAAAVLGMEAGNPNGLAVFQVRGAIPTGVARLDFDVLSRPRLGEPLFLVGFPQMESAPRMTQRVLVARRGTMLLVDQEIGEGFSGSPVLQGGKVVGVVTGNDSQTTFAVDAVVANESWEGWKPTRATPAPTATQSAGNPVVPSKGCEVGERRTVDGIVYGRICPGAVALPATGEGLPSEGFWIGEREVTNDQYRRIQPEHAGAAGWPATNVGWTAARAACKHWGAHLPTRAEWEYARVVALQANWALRYAKRTLFGQFAIQYQQESAWEWVVENNGSDPGFVRNGSDALDPMGGILESPLATLTKELKARLSGGSGLIGFRCVQAATLLFAIE